MLDKKALEEAKLAARRERHRTIDDLVAADAEPDEELRAVEAAITAYLAKEEVTEEMVEAGARAIFLVAKDWDTSESFDTLVDYGRSFWMDRARACLTAARRKATP